MPAARQRRRPRCSTPCYRFPSLRVAAASRARAAAARSAGASGGGWWLEGAATHDRSRTGRLGDRRRPRHPGRSPLGGERALQRALVHVRRGHRAVLAAAPPGLADRGSRPTSRSCTSATPAATQAWGAAAGPCATGWRPTTSYDRCAAALVRTGSGRASTRRARIALLARRTASASARACGRRRAPAGHRRRTSGRRMRRPRRTPRCHGRTRGRRAADPQPAVEALDERGDAWSASRSGGALVAAGLRRWLGAGEGEGPQARGGEARRRSRGLADLAGDAGRRRAPGRAVGGDDERGAARQRLDQRHAEGVVRSTAGTWPTPARSARAGRRRRRRRAPRCARAPPAARPPATRSASPGPAQPQPHVRLLARR